MADKVFSPVELDAIGEVMNISLGSSATAVSNLLDHRVEITTPKVSVVEAKDLSLEDIEPAVCVEIRYISGLEGSNIMLLKRKDVRTMLDILMGTETPDEEFQMDELAISAVSEVMNQMMGAASTALADFLGYPVNISTPETAETSNVHDFTTKRYAQDETCVVIRFMLKIEDILESQFINILSVNLVHKLLQGLGVSEGGEDAAAEGQPAQAGDMPLSQEEIERLMQSSQAPEQPESPPASDGGQALSQEEIERLMQSAQASPPKSEPAPASDGGQKLTQEEIERLMQSAQTPPPQPESPPAAGGGQKSDQLGQAVPPNGIPAGGYPYPPYGQYPPYPFPGYYPPVSPGPKKIETKPITMSELEDSHKLPEQQSENLGLLMSVPLEVSVEIGRTHKKVQDILALSKGSLVVLNKLAGDQVDLYVNGQCIAKGDVVVVDDNFGVRITEILKTPRFGASEE